MLHLVALKARTRPLRTSKKERKQPLKAIQYNDIKTIKKTQRTPLNKNCDLKTLRTPCWPTIFQRQNPETDPAIHLSRFSRGSWLTTRPKRKTAKVRQIAVAFNT